MEIGEYIHKIKKGDSTAFDQLFQNNYEALCNYAYSIVKDYAISEDLVQDFFVKIWVSRKELNPAVFNKGYLSRSVYNRCLDMLKHQGVKHKYILQIESHPEIEYQDTLSNYELSEKIDEALLKLPEKRREIFYLSRFDGLKYKEIAQLLNISENTVDTQIRRALRALRTDLKDYLLLLIATFLIFF
ncbi:RNA polymerase sigma-70 factor [Mariniphaga sediminis]|uniref:RNA polymerase sigma-70 factor n=1 Tax=Mariniphaga sediminis TaxID=1628158 RepID=UPI003569A6B6